MTTESPTREPVESPDQIYSLEAWRRRRALSQRDLQDKSTVQQAQISRIETMGRNGRDPNVQLRTVRKIAEALEVEPAQIAEFRPRLGYGLGAAL